jgi:hypothetical protein
LTTPEVGACPPHETGVEKKQRDRKERPRPKCKNKPTDAHGHPFPTPRDTDQQDGGRTDARTPSLPPLSRSLRYSLLYIPPPVCHTSSSPLPVPPLIHPILSPPLQLYPRRNVYSSTTVAYHAGYSTNVDPRRSLLHCNIVGSLMLPLPFCFCSHHGIAAFAASFSCLPSPSPPLPPFPSSLRYDKCPQSPALHCQEAASPRRYLPEFLPLGAAIRPLWGALVFHCCAEWFFEPEL